MSHCLNESLKRVLHARALGHHIGPLQPTIRYRRADGSDHPPQAAAYSAGTDTLPLLRLQQNSQKARHAQTAIEKACRPLQAGKPTLLSCALRPWKLPSSMRFGAQAHAIRKTMLGGSGSGRGRSSLLNRQPRHFAVARGSSCELTNRPCAFARGKELLSGHGKEALSIGPPAPRPKLDLLRGAFQGMQKEEPTDLISRTTPAITFMATPFGNFCLWTMRRVPSNIPGLKGGRVKKLRGCSGICPHYCP